MSCQCQNQQPGGGGEADQGTRRGAGGRWSGFSNGFAASMGGPSSQSWYGARSKRSPSSTSAEQSRRHPGDRFLISLGDRIEDSLDARDAEVEIREEVHDRVGASPCSAHEPVNRSKSPLICSNSIRAAPEESFPFRSSAAARCGSAFPTGSADRVRHGLVYGRPTARAEPARGSARTGRRPSKTICGGTERIRARNSTRRTAITALPAAARRSSSAGRRGPGSRGGSRCRVRQDRRRGEADHGAAVIEWLATIRG